MYMQGFQCGKREVNIDFQQLYLATITCLLTCYYEKVIFELHRFLIDDHLLLAKVSTFINFTYMIYILLIWNFAFNYALLVLHVYLP